MTRGNGSQSRLKVGLAVRDLLEEHTELYGQQLHALVMDRTGRHSSYASFAANYINKLKKLNLIVETRTEPIGIPGFADRKYWRINPNFRDHTEKWYDPQKAYLEKIKEEIRNGTYRKAENRITRTQRRFFRNY